MIIVGNNLKELIQQFNICPLNQFDETGIKIQLSNKTFIPNPNKKEHTIKYNITDVKPFFIEKNLDNGILRLKPKEICLCCSISEFHLPTNYFGVVQTKGSLARLFVTTNVTDSQVDPGYKGRITLEFVNYSPFIIEIPVGSIVAQLYIHKCSTNAAAYNGRYQNSTQPSLSKSEHS